MAKLTTEQIAQIRSELAQESSAGRESLELLKPDDHAAIAAIDQWIDDNRAAFNAAIPEPARSALTGRQKLRRFLAIVAVRFAEEPT
jgi:hypothetical protein